MDEWEEDNIIAGFGGPPPPPRPVEVKTSHDRLKEAFSAVMSFPEGVTAMRQIMLDCGWTETARTYDPKTSELNPWATIYNGSQRDVWLKLREHLTPQQRALIETEDQPWVKEEATAARIAALKGRLGLT